MLVKIVSLVMVCLFCILLVGCVAPEDKARLSVLEEKAREYEEKAADIRAKLQAGTLTSGEAEKLYEGIKSDTQLIADEINILKAKGYSPLEIILAILERLALIGASYGAVRLSRGGIHNRRGEAPA